MHAQRSLTDPRRLRLLSGLRAAAAGVVLAASGAGAWADDCTCECEEGQGRGSATVSFTYSYFHDCGGGQSEEIELSGEAEICSLCDFGFIDYEGSVEVNCIRSLPPIYECGYLEFWIDEDGTWDIGFFGYDCTTKLPLGEGYWIFIDEPGSCTSFTYTDDGSDPDVSESLTVTISGGECEPLVNGVPVTCEAEEDGGGEDCPPEQGASDEDTEDNGGGDSSLAPVSYLTGHKIERNTDVAVSLPGRDFELVREYSSDPDLYGSSSSYYWNGATDTIIPGQIGVNWSMSVFKALVGDHDSGSIRLTLTGYPLRSNRSFVLVDDGGDERFVPRASTNEYIVPTTVDIPLIGTAQSVYRMRTPGGVEVDFARMPGTLPTGDNGLGMEDLAGLPVFERDAYGNTWWYEYDILVDNTTGPRDVVVLDALYLNWGPGGNFGITSDDTWDAKIDFEWNGLDNAVASGSDHFGRVSKVTVIRPGSSGTVETQKVAYTYFDEFATLSVGSPPCYLTNIYEANPGDLVEVVASTKVQDNDDVNKSGDWYDRVWQYRYHQGGSTVTLPFGHASSASTVFVGEKHQLLAAFYPEQIEHFADHYIQQGGSISSETGSTVVRAAHRLRWVNFDDRVGESHTCLAYAWENYFEPGDHWQTLFDVASKVIGYYGGIPQGGSRVKTQLVNASPGSGCGCGGGVASSTRLGKRFDYLYKRYAWGANIPDGIPADVLNSTVSRANGYSCQIVESQLAVSGSTVYFSPYRVFCHDYFYPSSKDVGDLTAGGGLGVAWKVAATVAEADTGWNYEYNSSTDPVAAADGVNMTGLRWTTLFEYTEQGPLPPQYHYFRPFRKIARTYTASSLEWDDYVAAEDYDTNTTAPVLPAKKSDGLSIGRTYAEGWETGPTYYEGDGVSGVSSVVITRSTVRPDLPTQVTRSPGTGPTADTPSEVTTIAYGYHNGSDPDLEKIVAWQKMSTTSETEAQNGPASSATYVTFRMYDTLGQLRWEQDADGRLTYYEYDDTTGALTKVVRDANPSVGGTGASLSSDFPGLSSGGYTAPSGPFESLTTTYGVDDLGRVVSMTDPSGVTHYTRYEVRQTDNVLDDGSIDYRGVPYMATVRLPFQLGDDSVDGPVSVTWSDAGGREIRSSAFEVDTTATYTPASGVYTESAEVARSDTERMISGLPVRTREWHRIGDDDAITGENRPYTNEGSYVTEFVYDSLGRVKYVIDPEKGVTEYAEMDLRDRPTEIAEGVATWTSLGVLNTPTTVTTAQMFYDSPQTEVQGVGNGNVTLEKRSPTASSGDDRVTKRWYDYRDRLIGVLSPLAPHRTLAYDELNRVVESATFTSGSGFTAGGAVPDPGSNSDRSTYTQTLYNNRGMVYRTRTAIDPTQSSPEFLESNRWFDADGNVIASWDPNGPATKTVYDNLDRPSVMYVTDRAGDALPGASDNHADAAALTGDRVLEQTEYLYVADDDSDDEGAGSVELVTHRMRLHDSSATGALTGSTGVATYTLYEFDDAGRAYKTHNYGTNDSAFVKNTSAPNRPSAGLSLTGGSLVSQVGFDSWGRTVEQTSPDGDVTLTVLDPMSRQIAVIEGQTDVDASDIAWGTSNWSVTYPGTVNPDRDRVTTFVYDGLSNVILRTAHLDGSSAQSTRYVYGVTAEDGSPVTESLVSSSRLLWKVHYPNESTGAADTGAAYTVTYGYNRLGELRGMTDQNATTHAYTRDDLGRVTSDAVTITNSDLDSTVTEIATAYDAHGRVTTVTSNGGSGAVNGVLFGYTPLHQVAEVYQDHAAAATTSSPSIEYTYANADPDGTNGGNYSRIAGVDYPTDVANSTTTMAYGYGAAGSLDDRISRVAGIDVTGWDGSDPSLVDYSYLGVSTPVKVHYPLPTAGLGLDYTKEQDGTDGATAGAYPGFDQYGRVIWHAWISDAYTTGTNAGYADRTPVVARMYAYDDDSNRTRDWDARPGAVANDRDWAYSYDPLDRLSVAYRGRQTPGASGSGPDHFVIQAGSEKWDLDVLGNWDESYEDLDGTWTVNWNASTEGRTRTHNMANETLTREGVIGSGPGGSTPIFSHQHDANGNLRANNNASGGRSLRYVHDAWNRLVKVERWPSTGSPFAILENEFNGLNWRIRRKMDLSQGAYDGVDEERLYFFTPSWQMAEEWVDDDLDTTVEYRAQQFWGVRYIDDAVARRLDRDNDGAWTTDAEDNWYYLTDVMFSVRGITDNDGQIHTRVDYTPYGVAMHRYAADIDGNGLINNNDITVFSANASPGLEPGDSGYDPDADLNGDGFAAGYTAELDVYFNQRWSPYSTGGSNPTVNAGWIDNPTDPNGPDNSVGYDGYHFDLAGAADATSTGLYMVRHRVYDPGMGRWSERDPAHYYGGQTLYEFAASLPCRYLDPTGMFPTNLVPLLNLPPPAPSNDTVWAPGFDPNKPWVPGNSNGVTVLYNVDRPKPPPPPPPAWPNCCGTTHPKAWPTCDGVKPYKWWHAIGCNDDGTPRTQDCTDLCGSGLNNPLEDTRICFALCKCMESMPNLPPVRIPTNILQLLPGMASGRFAPHACRSWCNINTN